MAYILISHKPSEEKKELQLFIFQIKSLAKPASTKQPFHPFSHQSDRFQRVTVKCGRRFMQLCICNQALQYVNEKTGQNYSDFFEECNSITVPLQITGGTGVSCTLAAGAHWVTLTQIFQSHGKRVEPSSVSSRRDPTQKDTIDSSHTETDYLLLSFLFNNSSKANYGWLYAFWRKKKNHSGCQLIKALHVK